MTPSAKNSFAGSIKGSPVGQIEKLSIRATSDRTSAPAKDIHTDSNLFTDIGMGSKLANINENDLHYIDISTQNH
jgi:hypothetical protein